MNKVRTRFAPSPTGYLHIGGARTALYSWLYSKHNNGKFILRIEDTDSERSTNKAINAIIESMKWLGLNWDEGPYYQSKRFNFYNSIIDKMINKGTAYYCYCTKLRLDNLRIEQINKGEKPRYDSYCRSIKNIHKLNKPHVVRFCNPTEGFVIFEDQIRGKIKFNNSELDDLIIRRTDGSPTYNFCVVIDDWDMQITHVIRGDDHINNTPRQINILTALGAPIPIYAHVSMILGNNGKKLSKRYETLGIMEYRDQGYLPEALLNYLVRLGWSHGNQEIFNISEMIDYFSLKDINKSSSIFNKDKLLWLNNYYINSLPIEYIATHLSWHIKQKGININNGPNLIELIKLFGKRCKTLKEIADSCYYLYKDFIIIYNNSNKKYLSKMTILTLETIKTKLTNIKNWTIKNINNAIKITSIELDINMNKIGMPLRIAVTGTEKTPSIDTIIYIIGKKISLQRINNALIYIKNIK